ncbi:hypothetical protein DdX_12306 [Ditylenchus destructor]|uniref:F-box domain-containing protein n=1 Tax=Ditylenchus destructor TaxID=166010 RepID=A0AAD4MYM8_9BILA|nr:hypothetical protein DdX_12306 [Ditylenchus destructor]
MRRSVRLAEKTTSTEKEAQIGPKLKKNRLDDKTSKIAIFDNGTMVEAFKYLSYYQLAKSGFVSKRFRNLIKTHRHSLALLYVSYIGMNNFLVIPTGIRMFENELSPEDYNEWVIRNNYSKQIPPAAGKQSTDDVRKIYRFRANIYCKDSNATTTVFSARTKLNHESWPLFQHFVRLLSDPFVYIQYLNLTPLKELLHLLSEAINPDHGRIQCEELAYEFNLKTKKFWNWTKAHLCCNRLEIFLKTGNSDNVFFDLFMTGAHFTPNVVIQGRPLFQSVTDFVQKFIGLKNCDASQMIESIRCYDHESTVDALKVKYGPFFTKEEKIQYDSATALVFEFVNADIGKKLRLICQTDTRIDMKIINV